MISSQDGEVSLTSSILLLLATWKVPAAAAVLGWAGGDCYLYTGGWLVSGAALLCLGLIYCLCTANILSLLIVYTADIRTWRRADEKWFQSPVIIVLYNLVWSWLKYFDKVAAAALLDQVDGRVAAGALRPPLGLVVGDGTVPAPGLQEVGTEYLHPVMSPPLRSPVGEPDLRTLEH